MKKAIIATFVFLAMQAIVQAIGTFILGAFASGSPEETGQVSAAILAPTVIGIELLFAYLLTVGALYAWQMLTPASGLQSRRRAVPMAMLIMLALIAVANIVNELLGLPDMAADQLPALMYNPLCVICIALFGPVVEEIVFRRVVIGSLLEGGYRPMVAIAVSSLLFAAVHINPAQMPVAFIVGFLLGWLYVRTGSLLVPAACHVLNNVLGVVLFHTMPDTGLIDCIGGTADALLVAAAFSVAGIILLQAYIRLTADTDKFGKKSV